MNMLKRYASLLLLLLISACGGGGGDAGSSAFGSGSGSPTSPGTSPATGKASVSVSISTTTVSSSAPGTVTAAVRDSAGLALSGQLVSFSTLGGLGAFNVATALTDSAGVATVRLSPASPSANGADLVLARSAVPGGDVSGTIGFQVSAVSAPVVGIPTLTINLSSTSVTAAAPATGQPTCQPRCEIYESRSNWCVQSFIRFDGCNGSGFGQAVTFWFGDEWGGTCGRCRHRFWSSTDEYSGIHCHFKRRDWSWLSFASAEFVQLHRHHSGSGHCRGSRARRYGRCGSGPSR